MSKLKRKVQFSQGRGVTIYKTENILRRNKSEMERASKLSGVSRGAGAFPKITILRNALGKGAYTLFVGGLLINPLSGLTYREAVNMAYEIAVNPSKAFKGE